MKDKIKQLILIAALLLLCNVLSNYFFYRFDFTKDKRFSLTQLSKNEIDDVKSPMQITVFLDGDLPATFKHFKSSVNDILMDYKAYSHGKLGVNFINPLTDIAAPTQDSLMNMLYGMGLQPTNLNVKTESGFQQKVIFPELIITYKDKQKVVKLLQNFGGNYEQNINNSIENLEYTITSAIQKLKQDITPRIAFTEGHGELNDLQLQDAITSLSDNYEVGRINLKETTKDGLDKIKLLIIAKPSHAFSEAEKYKIDYLVQKGTSVIWSIDQVSADLDSLKGAKTQLTFNNALNIDDILFEYGARINYNIIADMSCAQIPMNVGNVGAQAQIQMVPWLYYPVLMPDTLNKYVKNIDPVRSEFASTVDAIQLKNVQAQTLLSTSPYRKIYPTPKIFSLQMVEEEPNPKAFFGKPQVVALLLQGKFPSVFAMRNVPQGDDKLPFGPAKTAKMVVIGDGDIFKNQISDRDGSVFPLGFDRYSQQNYGNKNLLLNLADGLIDASGLIDLRNKQFKMRLLDKVKLKESSSDWQVLNVALPLALLIIFAFFQQYFRKRRFAK